jgi:hypothetical protein
VLFASNILEWPDCVRAGGGHFAGHKLSLNPEEAIRCEANNNHLVSLKKNIDYFLPHSHSYSLVVSGRPRAPPQRTRDVRSTPPVWHPSGSPSRLSGRPKSRQPEITNSGCEAREFGGRPVLSRPAICLPAGPHMHKRARAADAAAKYQLSGMRTADNSAGRKLHNLYDGALFLPPFSGARLCSRSELPEKLSFVFSSSRVSAKFVCRISPDSVFRWGKTGAANESEIAPNGRRGCDSLASTALKLASRAHTQKHRMGGPAEQRARPQSSGVD